MYVFANLAIGVGLFVLFIGLIGLIVPIVGVPLLLVGSGLVQIGRILRLKAREGTVRRQLGG